jgi:hypothetical protein
MWGRNGTCCRGCGLQAGRDVDRPQPVLVAANKQYRQTRRQAAGVLDCRRRLIVAREPFGILTEHKLPNKRRAHAMLLARRLADRVPQYLINNRCVATRSQTRRSFPLPFAHRRGHRSTSRREQHEPFTRSGRRAAMKRAITVPIE